jgi:hypothetical protein
MLQGVALARQRHALITAHMPVVGAGSLIMSVHGSFTLSREQNRQLKMGDYSLDHSFRRMCQG